MLLRQLLVRFLDDFWIDKLFGLRALDHRPDSNLGIVDEVLSNQLRLLHVTVHDAVEQSLPRLLNKLERRLLETRTQSDALEQRTETTSTEPTHGYSLLLRQHHYWSRELLASDTAPVSGFPFSGTAGVAGCGYRCRQDRATTRACRADSASSALPKRAADWLAPDVGRRTSPRSVRSGARPAAARLIHLPRSGYWVRSTSKLSAPPADDVTFTWNGGATNGTASVPPLSVPRGSLGFPAAVSVGAPTWSLEAAFTVRVPAAWLYVAPATSTSSINWLSRAVAVLPGDDAV